MLASLTLLFASPNQTKRPNSVMLGFYDAQVPPRDSVDTLEHLG